MADGHGVAKQGMEVKLAGWNTGLKALFKRDSGAKRKSASAPAVVRPSHVAGSAQRKISERSLLPGFHTTASDQVISRSNDRFAAIRSKLRHAFTPSQPVSDRRMFAGRDELLKTVIRAIEDQRLHIVLYGERGIGKTSVLHMLTRAASEARYIIVYSPCGANSTFEETFRSAAADIPLLFHSDFAPTTSEAETGSSLADLLPTTPLSPKRFGDFCAKLTGTRVLIILDEFDRCESGAFRRDVAELIKNLSDRSGRIQLVLAGVAGDLTDLVEHIPSIRRNIFAMRVPKMTDVEILQIIANGEREADFVFDPTASEFVVAIARGSPYIASLLCHHAGHAALDQGRSTIVPSDVWNAVDRAVLEFQGRIAKPAYARIQRLFDQGSGEALALAARASLAVDGAFGMTDLQTVNEVDERTATSAVKLLVAEGLLAPATEEDGERYVFVEEGLPMFLWIFWAQQNMALEPRKARAASRQT